MVAGFVSVPFFKFAAPPLLNAIGWEQGTAYLGALDVLLPAFLVSGAVAVSVSLFDKRGQERLAGIEEDLANAGSREP